MKIQGQKLAKLLRALLSLPAWRDDFEQVSRYCMFVGYPRSGHSLVGSLLSAHPHIVISHELDALNFLRIRLPRPLLFSLILLQDGIFHRQGREWIDYNYAVEHLWHGCYESLQVIGDKKGGVSATRLGQEPALLDRLREKVDLPLRVIRVIRNPFDNISSISLRSERSLPEAIRAYFQRAEYNRAIDENLGEDELLEVYFEQFVSAPKTTLQKICEYLGVDAFDYYLDKCASRVYASPNRSRFEVEWSPSHIENVGQKMDRYPCFKNYETSWEVE